MSDLEFRLAKRLYESLDYEVKIRFWNFAQGYHRAGYPYPSGWLDSVKYLCECHNRGIDIPKPTENENCKTNIKE